MEDYNKLKMDDYNKLYRVNVKFDFNLDELNYFLNYPVFDNSDGLRLVNDIKKALFKGYSVSNFSNIYKLISGQHSIEYLGTKEKDSLVDIIIDQNKFISQKGTNVISKVGCIELVEGNVLNSDLVYRLYFFPEVSNYFNSFLAVDEFYRSKKLTDYKLRTIHLESLINANNDENIIDSLATRKDLVVAFFSDKNLIFGLNNTFEYLVNECEFHNPVKRSNVNNIPYGALTFSSQFPASLNNSYDWLSFVGLQKDLPAIDFNENRINTYLEEVSQTVNLVLNVLKKSYLQELSLKEFEKVIKISMKNSDKACFYQDSSIDDKIKNLKRIKTYDRDEILKLMLGNQEIFKYVSENFNNYFNYIRFMILRPQKK